MTLEEAIESLGNLERHPVIYGWSKSRDAAKIGIEALKQIQRIRLIEGKPDICWLPGETKESSEL